jgi:dTDP-4-amino-4,6-dideoxygalactose transaminase
MIPFNKPWLSGREKEYLNEALDSGQLCGDHGFSKRCQALMEERFSARRVLLTTSCTSALELAALLLDVGSGDEVILPSYTFVSTANAFLLRGATLRFVDIEPDTLNIDPAKVAEAVTGKTKVIVPVHYAGVGCDMDAISAIASRQDIAVVEDAAQGVDATYNDQHLGTIGDLGTYSFHETKNFVCGEGGALVINNPELVERAEILREKGTNRSLFLRGQVDKYTWVDVGASFLSADLLAAVLHAQLEAIETITASRAAAYAAYHEEIAPLEEKGLLRRPILPTGRRTNYHMYHILLKDLETRTRLIQHLKDRGISAVFHYVPLHTSPVGKGLGYTDGMLPVTEDLAQRLLRLPMYAGLTPDQCRTVCRAISDFLGG